MALLDRKLGSRLRRGGGRGGPVKNRDAAYFEVDTAVISEFVVDVLVPAVGVRPYPLDELMLMAGAVCWLEPTHIFEWGTHQGKSARVFWETTRNFRIPSQIVSVDLPDDVAHVEHPGAARGSFIRGIREIELLQGDGLETCLTVGRLLPDDARVLFFLDGDHSFEAVERELAAILREVPRAVVLVHDTFLQSEDSGYNVGPFEAVERVLAGSERRYERVATSTGLPGMTLLIPRS